MSAIWGAVNLLGDGFNQATKDIMKASFSDCAIDRYEEISGTDVYFGCGIQYITPEAVTEQLPYQENGVFFTADVILDNREELLEKIGCIDDKNRVISDGEILFKFYTKFGNAGLNDILGSYTFVIYDSLTKQVNLISDSVGSRALYYCLDNHVLYFSNLLQTIKSVCNNQWNVTWLGSFVASRNLGIFRNESDTVLDGVFYVPLATRVTVNQDEKIVRKRYWKPLKRNHELRFKNDNECKEVFNQLVDQCVKCLLRSNEGTAIMLSSGLDSTAVACFASPYLKEKGQKLYSYTSVPVSDYQEEASKTIYTNERDYVLQTKEYLQNLECSFLSVEEANSWNRRTEYMKFYEMPYKSVQNVIWVTEIAKKARADGNRIILSGQTGNGAFSYGKIYNTINTLFHQGKFAELMDEINILHRHGGSRKKNLETVMKTALKRIVFHKPKASSLWERTYIQKNAVKKYQLDKVLNKWTRDSFTLNVKDARKHMVSKVGFRQAAEFETRQTLRTGLVMRDATRDKRLLSFCMQLPARHFAWGITERRLVKEYLADRMPPFIKMENRRGLQAADTHFRIKKDWDTICNEMLFCYRRNIESTLVDCKKAIEALERYRAGYQQEDEYDIVQLIYTAMTLEYMEGAVL